MFTCSDGHHPTELEMVQAKINVISSVDWAIANKLLPHDTAVIERKTTIAAINHKNYPPEVYYSKEAMACFTPKQTKGIVAHEVGHWNEGNTLLYRGIDTLNCFDLILPAAVLASLLISSAETGLLSLLIPQKSKVWKKVKKIMREKENKHGLYPYDFPLFCFRRLAIVTIAVQASICLLTRQAETDADLFSAHVIGSTNDLKAALKETDALNLRPKISEIPSLAYIVMVELYRFGVPGSLVKTHPSINERLKNLDREQLLMDSGISFKIVCPIHPSSRDRCITITKSSDKFKLD